MPIREVYVTEGFDDKAVSYFATHAQQDGRTVTLIAYKFFPAGNYIEFWSVYSNLEEQHGV
jgi:hypothetical protein